MARARRGRNNCELWLQIKMRGVPSLPVDPSLVEKKFPDAVLLNYIGQQLAEVSYIGRQCT